MTLQSIYDLIYNYQLYIYNCEDDKTIEKFKIKIDSLKQKVERILKLNRILGINEKCIIKTIKKHCVQKELEWRGESNMEWGDESDMEWT